MTQEPLRVGVVGCGNISLAYLTNAPMFPGVRMVACADLNELAAATRARDHGLQQMTVDEILTSPDVDLILNLTIPAAHHDVSMRALTAGKHVFSEKPLGVDAGQGRALVTAAAQRGLFIGSAPDTFMGPSGRLARQLLNDGAIGTPVTGTAFMMGRGMEHWHPDPGFYYQPGAGPVMDMGPYYLTMMVNLMGPVTRVQAVTATGQPTRVITAPGPRSGTSFAVGTPTTVLSLLTFANGAIITFGTSWDVFRHSNHPIEIHGTAGSLRLPDPDNFGGTVGLSRHGAPWEEVDTATHLFGTPNWPLDAPDRANYRMLGLADMARAIRDGGEFRASGALALHVLEVMAAILTAGETRQEQIIPATTARPDAFSDAHAQALLA